MLVFLWFSALSTANLTDKIYARFSDIVNTKIYKEAIPDAITIRSLSACSRNNRRNMCDAHWL